MNRGTVSDILRLPAAEEIEGLVAGECSNPHGILGGHPLDRAEPFYGNWIMSRANSLIPFRTKDSAAQMPESSEPARKAPAFQ